MGHHIRAAMVRGLAFAAALLVSACARPYDPPQVFDEVVSGKASSEVPASGFGGLDDILRSDPRVAGRGLPLRVLWTHGMCTPDKPGGTGTWWQVRMRDIEAAYPGAQTIAGSLTTETLPNGAKLTKEDMRAPGPSAPTIEYWFLTWTPITDPYKLTGDKDPETGPGNPYRYARATVNNSLKQGLMKDCLADVVTYLGANGDAIRSDTLLALCRFFGGNFDSATGCAGASDEHATVLISESLGSSILFDAFRTLRSQIVLARQAEVQQLLPGPKRKISPSDMRAIVAANVADVNGKSVGKAMGSLTTFFMLANQIPLVSMANRSDPNDQQRFDEFVTSAAEARPTGAPPLTVVAFVDPNDVLSFRLVPRSNRARIVNFVVSNANTYAGYFERPDVAHCNYAHNGYVMHAIVYGYAGGTPLSGKVDDPEPCL